ncbi:hypothetical protein M0R45_004360 [Rubus argutus]|uniref:Uncharacterized protein n=1 Tax=Rubus argutus TaxID=59490 RepID=A0AAW1YJK4_RUBAR
MMRRGGDQELLNTDLGLGNELLDCCCSNSGGRGAAVREKWRRSGARKKRTWAGEVNAGAAKRQRAATWARRGERRDGDGHGQYTTDGRRNGSGNRSSTFEVVQSCLKGLWCRKQLKQWTALEAIYLLGKAKPRTI